MATRSFEDVKEGDAIPPFVVEKLSRTDLVKYAGASGDFNPIHHDDEFAQSAGYPTAFSVGMLQAGILASYATDWLGPRNVRKFGVQFREQVWPGDRLVCTGTVIDRDETARTVDLELVVTRVGGGAAIKGSATFAVA